MSLISQNAVVKDTVKKKVKRKGVEGDEASLLESIEDIPENEGSEVMISNKKKKRNDAEQKKLQIEEEIEMKELGGFLFGSLHSPLEFGKENENEEEAQFDGGDNDSSFFVVDRSGTALMSDNEENAGFQMGNGEDGHKERKPVWVDDEEEKAAINIAKVNRLRKLRKEEDESVISGLAYVSRLRAQHVKLNHGTNWADLDSKAKGYSSGEDSEVENVDDILRTNDDLVVKRGAKLMPGILEYSKLADANSEDSSNARISSVEFHRNHQLLLSGGFDRKLRFFQVDGKKNKMMDVIFFEDCPIHKAAFLPDGSHVILSGRRKFFYSIDIVKGIHEKIGPLTGREEKSLESFEVSPDSKTIAFIGNEGYILLVSSKTKELIGTLKMNGTVRFLAFSPDGQQLLSSGGDGQVYHWDLRTRTCLHKGVDEGSLNGTSLCTSPIGNLFATGSTSGIVNIYNREEFLGGKRKPLKSVGNLTTEVDFMKFNHDAQMLAICSSKVKNSVKLVHIPSFTVFSNWPPQFQKLGSPCCVDFSPASGFMALGGSSGKVLLYKLHHYDQA